MRNYEQELKNRVEFIQQQLKNAGAKGIIFANGGGKDSTLTGILCKKACDDTVSISLPISKRNFGEDLTDGVKIAEQYGIENRIIPLDAVRDKFIAGLNDAAELTDMAKANMSPRLRMITLYAIAQSENRLVAGTSNRSEQYLGYFTKWGDGAYDFNPIADLTVREIYEFLGFLKAPETILTKAPSGALYDGQTDEQELGLTYDVIDDYILKGKAADEDRDKIEEYHRKTAHKRNKPPAYKD